MNSLLTFLFLTCFVVFASAADDQQCRNDFHTFMTCMKNQHEEGSDDGKDKQARQQAVDQCFQQSGCDAPDPNSNGDNKQLGQHIQQMPDAVKQCIKRKMFAKIGDKMNECLKKHGVDSVNFTQLADQPGGDASFDGSAQAKAGKDGIHGAMQAKMGIVKAVDKCCQKKGGDTNAVHPLEECLQKVKHDEKPKVCEKVKPCQSKLSTPCKQRGQDIHKAMCLCKKEKEKEISGKLAELAKSQQKIGMQDLLKTVADDQDIQQVMGDVKQCYQDTGTPIPIQLQLAMTLLGGGGAGGRGGGLLGARMQTSMSVEARTCVIMSDMLALDAQDASECEPCPA